MDKFLLELDDLGKKHNIGCKYVEGLEEKIDFVKELQTSTSTSFGFSTSYFLIPYVFAVTTKKIKISFYKKTKERVR